MFMDADFIEYMREAGPEPVNHELHISINNAIMPCPDVFFLIKIGI